MPDRSLHKKFDVYLAERGVLIDTAGYEDVHRFIDLDSKVFGSRHRDEDYYHD